MGIKIRHRLINAHRLKMRKNKRGKRDTARFQPTNQKNNHEHLAKSHWIHRKQTLLLLFGEFTKITYMIVAFSPANSIRIKYSTAMLTSHFFPWRGPLCIHQQVQCAEYNIDLTQKYNADVMLNLCEILSGECDIVDYHIFRGRTFQQKYFHQVDNQSSIREIYIYTYKIMPIRLNNRFGIDMSII